MSAHTGPVASGLALTGTARATSKSPAARAAVMDRRMEYLRRSGLLQFAGFAANMSVPEKDQPPETDVPAIVIEIDCPPRSRSTIFWMTVWRSKRAVATPLLSTVQRK